MKKAKSVFHHDDPPCEARLDINGDCPECSTPKRPVHPDMQSLAIWFYCPDCDCPLKNMQCPNCKKTFKRPN